MHIIDTPWSTRKKITCLASSGVRTIIRYYNFSNSASLPEKCLQRDEAQVIVANGMNIAVVFQQGQNAVECFSKAKGFAAGQRAYRHAHDDIGQPNDSAVYFAVDFDAGPEDLASAIIPYFAGVREAFAANCYGEPAYKVGVYGSGLVCDTLVDKGLAELRWLSMSHGFRGTREALKAGRYHLAQRGPEAILCGLDVDYNDANPQHQDFGAFSLAVPATLIARPTASGQPFRVTARNGLLLREGPGTNFEITGGLRLDQVVFVCSTANGWALVDIEGDGRNDGYVAAAMLEAV